MNRPAPALRALALLLPFLAACAATSAPSSRRVPTPTAQDAGGSASDLAKQLSNPVASLISVPLQLNYDEDVGPSDGERFTLNVQPVVPISLNDDWNLISRTILPILAQNDIPGGNDEFGLGDTVQSFFFSPVEPTEGGWIWGAGPALLLPTGTDDTLGADQWGIGPTGVALRQEGPWTYGMLANHIWSFAGDDDRGDVNQTFVQPFVSYTTPEAWTYVCNSESTYDWEIDDLALPINVLANKIVNWGGQLMQVGGGLRYWVEDTDASPEGLALRFNLIFLFPR